MTTPTRTRKPKNDLPPVTVTDAQYQELLAIRLAAMKGFEAGTVTAEDKAKARTAVRRARVIRKAEAEALEAHREAEARAEEEKLAKAEARKAARASKKAVKVETPTEAEADESEGDRQMEAEVAETE